MRTLGMMSTRLGQYKDVRAVCVIEEYEVCSIEQYEV
jgi:hypothetical protein